jgi:hypothetical protein
MRLRCPFCGDFLPLHQMQSHSAHPNGCPCPLYTSQLPLWCFTCGVTDASEFSKTQLAHAAQVGFTVFGGLAHLAAHRLCFVDCARARDVALQDQPSKCKKCLEQGRKRRWQPSFAFASHSWNAGEELTRAVQDADLPRVQHLLGIHGRSISNHARQLCMNGARALGCQCDLVWDDEGKPWPDHSPDQPCTPLRLVAFRISDCCLTRTQMAAFCAIAQLLVSHGADAVDASDYMSSRYGSFALCGTGECGGGGDDDDDVSASFEAVWKVVDVAAQAQKAG